MPRTYRLYRVFSELSKHDPIIFNDKADAYKHLEHIRTLYPRKDYRLIVTDVVETDDCTSEILASEQNSVRQDAIFSGEFNNAVETVALIVARVAHVALQSELDWDASAVYAHHPSLVGLTRAQIDFAIREALA